MFMALYLSLYVAFVLGIYTLDRAYGYFIAAVEQSQLSALDKLGCQAKQLSDVTYVLFTLSLGDNLKDVLSEGRQDATNSCGGLQVLVTLLSVCKYLIARLISILFCLQHLLILLLPLLSVNILSC